MPRRFQFRLRQLFLIVTIGAVLAGGVLVHRKFSVNQKREYFRRAAEAKKLTEKAR